MVLYNSGSHKLCDVCGNSCVNSGGVLEGVIKDNAKKFQGNYKVCLCELCFSSALSQLSRDKMTLHMFDEDYVFDRDSFGRLND